MTAETKIEGSRTVLRFLASSQEVLDSRNAATQLNEAMAREMTYLVLDLTGVEVITASFCGLLASAALRMKQKGGRLRILVSPNGGTHEMLRVTSLDTVIDCQYSLQPTDQFTPGALHCPCQ